MRTGTKVVLAILAMLPVVVLVQNAAVTEFRFLFWGLSMSRALLFMLFLLLGVAIGLALCALRTGRRREP